MRRRGKGRGRAAGRSERSRRPGKGARRKAAKETTPRAPSKAKRRIGELKLHRDGYGFVLADRPGDDDVFVPAHAVGDALHTDLVEVRVVPGRGGKLEGRIVRVVERGVERLMGRFERHGRTCRVVTDDLRVRHRVQVPDDATGGAKHGDNVVVRIRRYPEGELPMLGVVEEVLGMRGQEATERAAIITKHQLRHDFPPKVERAAEQARALLQEGGGAGREDLRDIPFVTIDGENAQDFDDAVAVSRRKKGIIRLWVAIADVSFFVRPQSELDRAAYERGTSVYFPAECLPMLPTAISNDLCSLRPDEERYTMTAELDIDESGAVVGQRFFRSVIRSRERMTYTAIRKILLDRDEAERKRYAKRLGDIALMQECFERLRQKRLARGSIDFDLPEPEIVLDMQGDISEIVRAERHVGHMMIEEFMIAANEAVAEFLTEARVGCIYRVHESPQREKLKEFGILAHNLGLKARVRPDATPGQLAKVVAEVRGRPEERMVNHALLRSMSQAVYSEENLGHFGLASTCYCHFTSPIRRYPDLVVHRLLTRAIIQSSDRPIGKTKRNADGRTHERTIGRALHETAEHCSRRERIAVEAEREMAKLYAARFMLDHVGEEFDGVIAHVAKIGFFVELVDVFVEGLVPLVSLEDDRYRYDERGPVIRGKRRGQEFRVGDRVRVEVEEVDIPNREINFFLVSTEA